MSSLYGLVAFLMTRVCERGTRNFGRESRRGELYAASVLGIEFMMLLLSAALMLNAIAPERFDLKAIRFSAVGYILIWLITSIIIYSIFAPRGRYRRWSEEFKNRHVLVRERPAIAEVLTLLALFSLLLGSGFLHWLMHS